jgi:hypothetical protein
MIHTSARDCQSSVYRQERHFGQQLLRAVGFTVSGFKLIALEAFGAASTAAVSGPIAHLAQTMQQPVTHSPSDLPFVNAASPCLQANGCCRQAVAQLVSHSLSRLASCSCGCLLAGQWLLSPGSGPGGLSSPEPPFFVFLRLPLALLHCAGQWLLSPGSGAAGRLALLQWGAFVLPTLYWMRSRGWNVQAVLSLQQLGTPQQWLAGEWVVV